MLYFEVDNKESLASMPLIRKEAIHNFTQE